MISTVDHPVCKENFSIEPEMVYKITRIMRVPEDLRIGKYKVHVELTVLNPATCGLLGCEKKRIHSSSPIDFEVIQ